MEDMFENRFRLNSALDSLPDSIKQRFALELRQGYVNPNEDRRYMAYKKGDRTYAHDDRRFMEGLEEGLMKYFEQDVRIQFPDPSKLRRAMYKRINKEPLKRAYYGMLTDQKDERDWPKKIELPNEVLQPLVDFLPGEGLALLYLLAGRWARREGGKDLLNLMEGSRYHPGVHSRRFILSGMDEMVRVHNDPSNRRRYSQKIDVADLPYGSELTRFFHQNISRKAMNLIDTGRDPLIMANLALESR